MNWERLNETAKKLMVAILAGWEMGPSEDLPCGPFKIAAMTKWHHKSDGPREGWQDEPPNLLEDLDAMHEAEEALTSAAYDEYCTHLWNLCNGAAGKSGAIHASADKRAKALWLTLRDTRLGKSAEEFAEALVVKYTPKASPRKSEEVFYASKAKQG